VFGLSIWHIAIIVVVVFLLFGGRLSDLMGAAGKSLRSEKSLLPRLSQQFLPPFLQKILSVLFR
jgi:TatA/E family protein of Tat protein translocase